MAETRRQELTEGPAQPRHTIAPKGDWVWVPTLDHGSLAAHPWCTECGRIAALGSRRALDLGGLLNLMTRVVAALGRDGRRVTDVQKRLIMKRLTAMEADDRFGLTWEAQVKLITDVVAAATNVRPEIVETYVREC